MVGHMKDKQRCAWPGIDPLYVAYHDTDWGVPEHDGRALYEKLVLDGFQAGLSWITVLRKREAFRRAFAGFDPAAVSGFDSARVEALMNDPGIVRNRAKIEGAVASARAWLAVEEREGFSRFLWRFVGGRPVRGRLTSRAHVPAETELARKLSKDRKAAGFAFCGPTIVYAFMQAVGMTNDHLVGSFRHAECAALAPRP